MDKTKNITEIYIRYENKILAFLKEVCIIKNNRLQMTGGNVYPVILRRYSVILKMMENRSGTLTGKETQI